jgi:hypothetical protein
MTSFWIRSWGVAVDDAMQDNHALFEPVVFLNHFNDLSDPRRRGNVMYPTGGSASPRAARGPGAPRGAGKEGCRSEHSFDESELRTSVTLGIAQK